MVKDLWQHDLWDPTFFCQFTNILTNFAQQPTTYKFEFEPNATEQEKKQFHKIEIITKFVAVLKYLNRLLRGFLFSQYSAAI